MYNEYVADVGKFQEAFWWILGSFPNFEHFFVRIVFSFSNISTFRDHSPSTRLKTCIAACCST